MTAHDLIVAVDGGNSKTDVLLLRVDGTVLPLLVRATCAVDPRPTSSLGLSLAMAGM